VTGASVGDEIVRASQAVRCAEVELDHVAIPLSYDQQRGRDHARQLLIGEIRAPAA
jgi:hypothetical protein